MRKLKSRSGIFSVGLLLQALILSPSSHASSEPTNLASARIFISTISSPSEPDFSNDACKLIQDAAYDWNFGTVATSHCMVVSDLNSPEIVKAKESNQYDYSISLIARSNQTHYLVIENWTSNDPSDFRRFVWHIEEKANWKIRTKSLLARFYDFDGQKKRLREFLLVNGISADTNVGYASGGFFDRQTGSPLSFDAAYSRYRDESVRHRNYLQAGLEIVGSTGTQSMQYLNQVAGPLQSWTSSDFEDSDISDGGLIYSRARAQGLDPAEATLYTVAEKSAVEYAVEFRDEVSINDHINTTLGGFIIGKVLHEFGKLFSSGSETPGTRMLRATFGSPQRYDNWIAKTHTENRLDLDSTGFKPDVWGNASLFASSEVNSNPTIRTQAQSGSIGFDGQVIDIPLFDVPGRAHTLITDTVFASAFIQKGLTSDSLENFKIFAKTTLAAYYEKDLAHDSEGNLQGHNLFIGPSMGIDIEDANNKGHQQDKNYQTDFHGLVHVAGGTLDLTAYTQGFRIRCIIDVYGDLALMRSYAFEQYMNKPETIHSQRRLSEPDYFYYGVGTTSSIGLVVNQGRFEAGATLSDSRSGLLHKPFKSADSSDDTSVHDRRRTTEVWVAYQLSDSVKIRFGLEKNIRSGSVGDTDLTGSDIRKTATLIYTLK